MAEVTPLPFQKARLEWRVIGGIFALGAVLYLGAQLLEQSYRTPLFIGAPFVMGFVAGLFSARRPYSNTLCGLMFGVLALVLVLREGITCLIFALPVLVPAVLVGTVLGVWIRRRVVSRRLRRQIGGTSLLLCLAWQAADGYLDQPRQHPVQQAQDSVEIAAPPGVVFAALTERPLEVPQRWQWFLKLGLPMARRMEVLEPRLGGEVRMDLNFGEVHARITEFEPNRTFGFVVQRYVVHDPPFHITRLGRGPNYGLRAERVEDWLTILTTRYTLEPSASGGTRLTRSMVWRRHLFPDFYFEPLQQRIIARGQRRLLELVRETVEQRQAEQQRGPVALTPGSP